jgi:dihydropteroate synthase
MLSWVGSGGSRPEVMGVVNVTPDSFSDGGRWLDAGAAVAHGLELVAAGATLLDVGGESTRPGATPVDATEERRRVEPVIARLAAETGVPVSVDTTKAAVAAVALDVGAQVVNDVSAGRADAAMLPLVAERGARVILMHMLGDPRTMQDAPRYDDVVQEVGDFLFERAAAAEAAGIPREAIAVDPGIGFGKTTAHNLELLARLDVLVERLGRPVVVGTSRKRFIGRVLADLAGETGEPASDRRDEGTLATIVWAIECGARVVRVHDATSAARAVELLMLIDVVEAA